MSDTSRIPTDADQAQKSDKSQNSKAFECPKCKATKVAKSHPKNLDELSMRFIPKRPYRCLHCYHRFWKWESLFANAKRVWSWSIILVLLVVLLLLNREPKSPADAVIGSFYGANDTGEHLSGDPPQTVSKTITGGARKQTSTVTQANQSSTNNQTLSPDQLERQLVQARLRHRNRKRKTNEAKQARLRETMIAERAELESLLKVDIGYHIENWRKAWQAGDVDRYLNL